MNAKVERPASTSVTANREVIVKFNPLELKAPFLLRCGAILIDYILIVSVPIICLLIGRMLGDDGSKLLTSQLSGAGWLVAFLLALTNFVIFPMLSGQSIGKMLTGLRVVKIDGRTPGIGTLLARHLVGYSLTFLTLGLGFLLAVLTARGRALHDFLAGTIVIYGQRRQK